MDPMLLSATFIRRFLFIYGSQPPNYFTQNPQAGLLTTAHESSLLRDSAQAYKATHVHYTPPHTSITWPPQPVQTLDEVLAAPAAQHNTPHRQAGWTLPANATQWHQPFSPPEEERLITMPYQPSWHSHHTTTWHDWQYPPAWSWGHDSQPWNWSPQPGWTTTWHWY